MAERRKGESGPARPAGAAVRAGSPERAPRADARRNRELILRAAREVFSEVGFSAQVSEVARAAGLGVGTVYRHFPTKEALFDAVSVSYKQGLAREARSLLDRPDPGAALLGFLAGIVEDGLSNRAARDALRVGAFRARSEVSDALLDLRSALADLLARAQQAGAVREDVDATDLFALMSGLLMVTDELEGTTDAGRARRLAAVLLDGLRRGGAPRTG